VGIFYAKGTRVGNREILKSDINGELGYAACDFGFNPTNAFVQNFGHLAKKNVMNVEAQEAKAFAAGKNLKFSLGQAKSKYLVVKYKGHVVGLGYYDKNKGKIINRIPEKRRRAIINNI
jgi:NOL1/NOP2/fmu family ribosome biogenesis protein